MPGRSFSPPSFPSNFQAKTAAIDNPSEALSLCTRSRQARDMKRRVIFDRDAGLHTLRHTYLTKMRKITDVWTLMKLTGHSNITTTHRYVHPEADAMSKAAQAQWNLVKSKRPGSKNGSSKGCINNYECK